jgi:hypothetical protein
MPTNQAVFNSGGNIPQVEIIVGFAHFARYEFWLYDATGKNPVKFADGVNSDTIPDIFNVGDSVSALHNCTIFWRAAVASPTGAPGENYSIFIRVIQDGQIAGTDSKTGSLTDPPPYGFIRLIVG